MSCVRCVPNNRHWTTGRARKSDPRLKIDPIVVMFTPLKSKLSTYLPHCCSLVALPIFYASVMFVSNLQLLAVCAAALGVISAFLLCRTVQRRGQVSLAVSVIVLPLLVAGCCAILLQFTPLMNRQRSIAALRSAGVGVRASPPDQSDRKSVV